MPGRKRKVAPVAKALALRIGHLDIGVHPWTDRDADREDADGMYCVATDSIHVRASRGPMEQIRILLHEVLHVIWDVLDMEAADPLTEEEVCSKVALGLANVFKNNPHLVTLIVEAIGGKGIF